MSSLEKKAQFYASQIYDQNLSWNFPKDYISMNKFAVDWSTCRGWMCCFKIHKKYSKNFSICSMYAGRDWAPWRKGSTYRKVWLLIFHFTSGISNVCLEKFLFFFFDLLKAFRKNIYTVLISFKFTIKHKHQPHS